MNHSVSEPDDSSSGRHSVQLWCLDQMLSVVRNRKLPLSDTLLLDTGKFLLFHAFFTVKRISDEVCVCVILNNCTGLTTLLCFFISSSSCTVN